MSELNRCSPVSSSMQAMAKPAGALASRGLVESWLGHGYASWSLRKRLIAVLRRAHRVLGMKRNNLALGSLGSTVAAAARIVLVVSSSTGLLIGSFSLGLAANANLNGSNNSGSTGVGQGYYQASHGSITFQGDDDSCGTPSIIGHSTVTSDPLNWNAAGTNNVATTGYTTANFYSAMINNTKAPAAPVGATTGAYGVYQSQVNWDYGGGGQYAFPTATSLGSTFGNNGSNAMAWGMQSMAINCGSYASGWASQAVGINARAQQSGNLAYGVGALAAGKSTIAIGTLATAGSGTVAAPVGESAIAIGSLSNAEADKSVAHGYAANAKGVSSIAIGDTAVATTNESVAIGKNAGADGGKSVSIGSGNKAFGNGATTIGDPNFASGTGALALGANNIANSDGTATATAANQANGAVALGNSNVAVGQGSVAIGNTSQANNAGSIAVGDSAQVGAGAAQGVALGSGATVTHANSVALGAGSATSVGAQAGYTAYGLAASQTSSGEVNIGSRKLTGVAAGSAATDAVNVSQLNQIAQNTATSLGGGAAYNAVTGIYTAPGYSIANISSTGANTGSTTQTNVGAALTALSTNVGNVAGIAVKYDATGGNTITLGATGGVGAPAGGVKITNLTAGTLSAASTDAVNGSQLFTTNQSLTNLNNQINGGSVGLVQQPGGAGNNLTVGAGTDGTAVDFKGTAGNRKLIDVAAGTLSAASTDAVNGSQLFATNQNVATNTANIATLGQNALQWDSALGAFSAVHGSTTPQKIANVAAGTLSATSTDAVNGTQLFTTNQNLTNLNNQINSGSVGLVQQPGGAGNNLTVGAGTDGAAVDFKGTAGNRKLINVAAGTLSATSTDAVNGSQLFATNSATATALGGGAAVNGAGALTAPSYALSTGTATNVGAALTNIDTLGTKYFRANSGGVNSQATGIDSVAIGPASVATGNTSIAIGRGAQAQSGDAIAIGRNATAGGGQAIAIGVGNNAFGNGAVSLGDPNYASGAGALALGNTNIANADGTQTATAANQAPGAVALGNSNVAIGQGSVALGNTSQANNAGSIAIGDNAGVGSGATKGVALGSGTMVTGAGSVAIGANSTDGGQANVVSVGAAGNERKLVNLAAGTLSATSTDGVNGSQLFATNQTVATLGQNALQWDSTLGAFSAVHGSTTPQKITNVAAATLSAASTDAVNGSQLFATNQNVSNLSNQINSGSVGLVQQPGGAGNNLAVGAGTDGAAVDFKGTAGNRKLIDVAAGTLSATSTDAVNGSQLFATNSATATALGGGAAVNGGGALTGPNYVLSSGTVTNVGAALSNIDALGTKYFRANASGAASSAAGTNSVAIGQASTAGGTSTVAIGDTSTVAAAAGTGSIAGGHNSRVLGGTGAVALGESQTVNGNGAVAIGDPNSATGTGAVAVGANNTANGQGALALGNSNTATGQGSLALGNSSTASVAGGIALGDTATSSAANAVAIGQGSSVTLANSVALGSGSTASGTSATTSWMTANSVVSGQTFAVNQPPTNGVVAVGNRQIQGVADGEVSATSTDAVNGSQLFKAATGLNGNVNALGTATASALGGGATYTPGTGISAPSYAIANIGATGANTGSTTQTNVGAALTALNTNVGNVAGIAVKYDSAGGNTITLGATGGAGAPASGIKITNLTPGTLSGASTDAVNGSQLFTTNQNLTNLSNQITSGSVGLVQQPGGAGNNLTVGAGTDGAAVDFKGTAGNRKLINVAAGTLSTTSTDAVNGSQLFTTNQTVTTLGSSVASALGGTTSYNPSTGQLTGGFSYDGSSFASVQSVFNAINGSINGGAGIKYVHVTSTMPDSQATGGDSIGIGPNSVASGTSSIAMGNGAQGQSTNSIAIGTSAIAGGGAAVSIGAGNSAFGNGAVALGDPNFASGSGALALGANNIANSDGTATATAANQAQGAVALGNSNKAVGQGSVALGNTSTANNAGSIAIGDSANVSAAATKSVALGSGTSVTGANSVALGAGSTDGGQANVVSVGAVGAERRIINLADGTLSANSTEAVTGRQLFQTNQNVANLATQINSGSVGLVRQTAPGADLTVGAMTDGGAVNFQGTAGDRKLTHVAAGAVSSASTDAVNGAQLNSTNQAVAAVNRLSVKYVADSNGNPTNTVTLVGAGNGQAVKITNLADGVAPTDAVNVRQLQALGASQVTYDTNPDGTQNRTSLTFNRGGASTVLHNVAAGVVGTDAVNMDQLASTSASDRRYTDTQVSGLRNDMSRGFAMLDNRISGVQREERQGIAAAMAMASSPMPSAAGKTTWAANTAVFKREVGVGASFAHRFATAIPIAVTGGVSWAGNDNLGARVGLMGEF